MRFLKDSRRLWVVYAALLATLAGIYFGGLRHHLLDTHDADTFRDNLAISQDFSYFFSSDKAQGSGRPLAELLKWLTYLVWGNDPGWFHLLVVALHTAASGPLAWTGHRLRLGLGLSLAGGLLFMVNTAHFRAVHHISALDYPLAQLCALGAVLCYLSYLQTRRRLWLVGSGARLLLGLASHLASLVVLPLCLFLSWQRRQSLKATLLPLLPVVAVLAPAVAALLAVHSGTTSTRLALDSYGQESFLSLLGGMGRGYLWLVGRLLSTAHWVPLPVYRQQSWELFLGLVVLVGPILLLTRPRSPAGLGSAWILLSLVPFVLVTEDALVHLPAGPSRYLYLATAGSSFFLAWLVLHLAERVRRWRPGLSGPVGVGLLLGLLASSYVALKESEALSLYTSGRHQISEGNLAEGVAQFRQTLTGSRDIIPVADTYLRRIMALPGLDEDPTPMLRQALEECPGVPSFHAMLGVMELERGEAPLDGQGRTRLASAHEYALANDMREIFADNTAGLYHNLGIAYARQQDYPRSIRAFRNALTWLPSKQKSRLALAQTHNLHAVGLVKEGRVAEAIDAARRSLAIDSTLVLTRLCLGWLLYQNREWEATVDQFLKVLDEGPNSRAHFSIGLAYLAQGRTRAAEAAYRRALALFGPDEARRIGAEQDVQNLMAWGIQPAAAQEILGLFAEAR